MDAKTLGAYAIVYVVWGSTYIGIAIAVEGFPPYLMAASRFALAGAILFAWARWLAPNRPRGELRDTLTLVDWRDAFVVGGLMLGVGAGTLTLTETKMPAGVAALIVATVPLWLVVFNAMETKTAPARREWLGLLAGIVGIALLSREDAGWDGGVDILFVVLLAGASVSWSFGSLLSKQSNVMDLRLRTAMQMLCGGALLTFFSIVNGESWDVSRIDTHSWLAWAYLFSFGSVLAFTAYVWLLQNEPAPRVATYAFANPIVAVLLGAAMLAEPITGTTLVAGALIVVAVMLIVLRRPEKHAATKPRL